MQEPIVKSHKNLRLMKSKIKLMIDLYINKGLHLLIPLPKIVLK